MLLKAVPCCGGVFHVGTKKLCCTVIFTVSRNEKKKSVEGYRVIQMKMLGKKGNINCLFHDASIKNFMAVKIKLLVAYGMCSI